MVINSSILGYKEKMSLITQDFGEFLTRKISEIKPDFIVPIESKGAILLELSLPKINENPNQIIYTRAFDYIAQSTKKKSKFLLVDDAVFSGKSLGKAYNSLIENGVPAEQIYLTACLNFTSGTPGVDYDEDICGRTQFPPGIQYKDINRNQALRFMQDEILTDRMPGTCDHLLLGANINDWQYSCLIGTAAESNRLLNYFRRGEFQTAAILLDDLIKGDWDFPPKIRIWYNSKKGLLRLAPIASPTFNNETTINDSSHLEIKIFNLFNGNISVSNNEVKNLVTFEAKTLNSRLQVLPYMKYFLQEAGIDPKFDDTHLKRYFPGFSHQLFELIQCLYSQTEARNPSIRQSSTNENTFGFLGIAKNIINDLIEVYESQIKEGKKRKDFDSKGFTGMELIKKFSDNYSIEQIHAGIDYCFDMNFASAFRDKRDGKLSRAMRGTETLKGTPYHPGEIYGATVIYSQKNPTPAWLISKIFPIIENTTKSRFDGIIVSTKGPFGDYSRVAVGENSHLYWRDIPSDLWDTEDKPSLIFKPKKERIPEARTLTMDPIISEERTNIEAARFLCTQKGRKGTILLNILTSQYAGTDYLTYNLEQIIKSSISENLSARKNLRRHIDGFREKIEYLNELYKDGENILDTLKRRCSRLENLAPITSFQAEAIIAAAKKLNEPLIYETFQKLAEHVIFISNSCIDNNMEEVVNHLRILGFETANQKNQTAKQQLFKASKHLNNLLYALSARDCSKQHYENYVYKGKPTFESPPYFLAYDLTKARRKHSEDIGKPIEAVNCALNSLAQNWIVALKGKLSKAEVSSGDLRYGFFPSLEDTIQAASWMVYLSRQLSVSNCLIPQPDSFGIAITRGQVEQDKLGNLSGPTLDLAGHWLKGKLKESSDNLAGEAGRSEKKFSDSPIQILFHNTFPEEIPKKIPIGPIRTIDEVDKDTKVAGLDIKKYLQDNPTPWFHWTNHS